MRAACLLCVLILAKLMVLAGQPPAFSPWAPLAYFSQDVLVAAIAWAIDRILRRPRAGWIVYGLAVAYIAINVPVAIVLGSPLTLPMMRATGGALADSITYYLTWDNVARVLGVVVAGAALPFIRVWRPPSGGPASGAAVRRRPDRTATRAESPPRPLRSSLS
jgi:hypothetical protein